MRYTLLLFCLLGLGSAGCRCSPLAERCYDKVDCISDHKACLDRLYCPRLDVSRAGMPDWCSGRAHSKCRRCQGRCCCQGQAWYPTEHTMAYRASLAEAEAKKNSKAEKSGWEKTPVKDDSKIPVPPVLTPNADS